MKQLEHCASWPTTDIILTCGGTCVVLVCGTKSTTKSFDLVSDNRRIL